MDFPGLIVTSLRFFRNLHPGGLAESIGTEARRAAWGYARTPGCWQHRGRSPEGWPCPRFGYLPLNATNWQGSSGCSRLSTTTSA